MLIACLTGTLTVWFTRTLTKCSIGPSRNLQINPITTYLLSNAITNLLLLSWCLTAICSAIFQIVLKDLEVYNVYEFVSSSRQGTWIVRLSLVFSVHNIRGECSKKTFLLLSGSRQSLQIWGMYLWISRSRPISIISFIRHAGEFLYYTLVGKNIYYRIWYRWN